VAESTRKVLVSDLLSVQAGALIEMSNVQMTKSCFFCVLMSALVSACSDADSADKTLVETGVAAKIDDKKDVGNQVLTSSSAPGQTVKTPPTGPQYLRVVVERTLEGSFVRDVGAVQGPALAQVAKRALVWWINPRTDLRKNDVIELVYDIPDEGEPKIFAIWFTSSKLGQTLTAVRFHAQGNEFPRWFQPDGSELAVRLVNGPIRRYEQITSLLKDGRGHKGMDFKAPVGSKIYAPFSGKIVRKNWSRRGNGLCLDIERPNGIRIYLLHLDKVVSGLGVGSWVKAGQHVAFSGNTGRSTAPHLHYQIEKTRRGRVLDPLKMHKSTRFRLQGDEVKRMRHRLSRLERLRSRSIP
jgi:murein DD-endopeptidase